MNIYEACPEEQILRLNPMAEEKSIRKFIEGR